MTHLFSAPGRFYGLQTRLFKEPNAFRNASLASDAFLIHSITGQLIQGARAAARARDKASPPRRSSALYTRFRPCPVRSRQSKPKFRRWTGSLSQSTARHRPLCHGQPIASLSPGTAVPTPGRSREPMTRRVANKRQTRQPIGARGGQRPVPYAGAEWPGGRYLVRDAL